MYSIWSLQTIWNILVISHMDKSIDAKLFFCFNAHRNNPRYTKHSISAKQKFLKAFSVRWNARKSLLESSAKFVWRVSVLTAAGTNSGAVSRELLKHFVFVSKYNNVSEGSDIHNEGVQKILMFFDGFSGKPQRKNWKIMLEEFVSNEQIFEALKYFGPIWSWSFCT